MIICERCSKQLSDSTIVCPACGTVSSISRPPSNSEGQMQQSSISYEYSRGYQPQSNYPPQPGYNVPPAGYPPIAINVNVVAPVPAQTGNSGAVAVEVLLNIFLGIFGVGWLMAGETTTGVILLICSVVLYLPAVILGSIFTLGLGLICIIPLSIGGIILNAVLLNNTIKRKMMYLMVQTPLIQTYPHQ